LWWNITNHGIAQANDSSAQDEVPKLNVTVTVSSEELHAISDSEVAEDGTQNNEISNDEYVRYFWIASR